MGGFIQPEIETEDRESKLRVLVIGAVLVAIIVGVLAYISISGRQTAAAPHPYAANVKITNPKMSAAENFVGATVSYIDGTVTNTGNQAVTHAMVTVVFKDSMGQLAQREEVALHVLDTSGPYPDAVDLSAAPLGPEQDVPADV
jgi:hypothetical protein